MFNIKGSLRVYGLYNVSKQYWTFFIKDILTYVVSLIKKKMILHVARNKEMVKGKF